MPGQQLQTSGWVLGRSLSGSDAFETLQLFTDAHGVLTALRRVSAKTTPQNSPLDLFDEAELALESTNQGRTWFVKEHRHLRRHPGIGRSYAALQAAASLSALLLRNPLPDESRAALAGLLRQSLAALDGGARPDLVWFKALYCFLRDEGYPVKQDWWQHLGDDDRAATAHILNQPIAEQNPAPDLLDHLTRRLAAWVASDTEIRLA